MNNSYESGEVLELGPAHNSIRSMKVQDPFFCDDVLGSLAGSRARDYPFKDKMKTAYDVAEIIELGHADRSYSE